MIDTQIEHYAQLATHPPENIIKKTLYYLGKIDEISSELKWLDYLRFDLNEEENTKKREDKVKELESSITKFRALLIIENKRYNKKFV